VERHERRVYVRVILSHPFSGAIYWWFASQINTHWGPESKRPGHRYYRTLYGDVDKNIDIALACAVIFDDIMLPAADAVLRTGDIEPEDRVKFPELNMAASDWELVHQAKDAINARSEEDLLADPVISSVLRRVPAPAQSMALRYAAVDILMMSEYMVPIICAPGRRVIVRRLTELDVVDIGCSGSSQLDKGAVLSDSLEGYTVVAGLTFNNDDAYSLANIKWNDRIRQYAQRFQSALTKASDESDNGTLYELIADAWASADLAKDISGTFTATSRTMSAVGLLPIPGLSTVTGAAGMAADAASIASSRREEKLRWYELGPEIARYRALQSLENELRQRKLL
jgi:hypothetical protein